MNRLYEESSSVIALVPEDHSTVKGMINNDRYLRNGITSTSDSTGTKDGTFAILVVVCILFCFIWAPVMLRRCRAIYNPTPIRIINHNDDNGNNNIIEIRIDENHMQQLRRNGGGLGLGIGLDSNNNRILTTTGAGGYDNNRNAAIANITTIAAADLIRFEAGAIAIREALQRMAYYAERTAHVSQNLALQTRKEYVNNVLLTKKVVAHDPNNDNNREGFYVLKASQSATPSSQYETKPTTKIEGATEKGRREGEVVPPITATAINGDTSGKDNDQSNVSINHNTCKESVSTNSLEEVHETPSTVTSTATIDPNETKMQEKEQHHQGDDHHQETNTNGSSGGDDNDVADCLKRTGEEGEGDTEDHCQQHRQVEDDDEEQCCCICFNDYKEGDVVCYSHNQLCNHMFHSHCMSEWLLQHDECPFCRHNYLIDNNEDNNSDGNDNMNENTNTGRSSATLSNNNDQNDSGTSDFWNRTNNSTSEIFLYNYYNSSYRNSDYNGMNQNVNRNNYYNNFYRNTTRRTTPPPHINILSSSSLSTAARTPPAIEVSPLSPDISLSNSYATRTSSPSSSFQSLGYQYRHQHRATIPTPAVITTPVTAAVSNNDENSNSMNNISSNSPSDNDDNTDIAIANGSSRELTRSNSQLSE